MNRLRPRDRFVQDRSILSCYPLAKSRWPESCPPTGNKNSLSLLADRDPKGETGLTSGASPQRKKAEGSDTLTVRRPLPWARAVLGRDYCCVGLNESKSLLSAVS